ncbi:MAG: hypothetical protein JWN67_1245, partial [Actinomycetia bacterium]|nr:hypothetical protein [Actinomycetes bacterium]
MSHPLGTLSGMRCEQEAVELAADQHGVVGTWQLRAVGMRKQDVHRLRASPHWVVRSDRVLARSGSPRTDDQCLMAAVLDASPGAAIAGPTAAWMWGVPGFRLRPIHVVRHRGVARRPSTLAVVHEVVDLHPSQI